MFYHQPGRGGQHALQPCHRRHGQGPPGAGAGRPGRRDGPGRRQGLHPVPHPQPGQRPGGVVPACSGRPAGVPEDHEAYPGAPGEPVGQAGRGGGYSYRKWRCLRRGHPHRSSVRREGSHYCHRHLSGWPHHCGRGGAGLRPRRPGRRPAPHPVPAGAGCLHPPLQDGHAPPG